MLVASLLILVSACGGLPGNERRAAKALPAAIETSSVSIKARETAYTGKLKADPEIAGYLARERVAGNFPAAQREITRARRLFETGVKPILDRNDREETAKLATAVSKVDVALRRANDLAELPGSRLARLTEAKKRSATWSTQASRFVVESRVDHQAATALVARYRKSHPSRADAIASRFASGDRLIEEVEQHGRTVAQQAAFRANGKPVDYALFADSFTALTRAHGELDRLRQTLAKDLPSLDRTYSKVLIDMKVDYVLCVSRTSWNEAYDYPDEHPYQYPCKLVSEDVFETAEEFDDREQEFMTYQSGWSSWSTRFGSIPEAVTEAETEVMWKELGFDPHEAWPSSSDNASSFDVESATARHYHRYAYVTNGVRTEGEFEEVSAELFDEHYDDLGLALLEKPYGAFESEAVKTASPPGMALVGNPKAGEWKSDGHGGSFWFWYPLFMNSYGGNMYGPGWNGYSRSEWDDYRRRREHGEGYYGGTTGGRTYGTTGSATQTGPARESNFARRGGFKEAAAEVRSAGPSGRSGGPQSGK